ncbi:hypothetical protein SLA2020_043750 [Shorea laevis]
MGRSGGRGGGGISGGGFHSSSGLTSKNRKDGELRKGCVAANSGSAFWSWWSSLGEAMDCRQLYVLYNKCLAKLEDKEDDNLGCYRYWQQFEGPCDKFKSRWSRWWTKEDEKTYCKDWSKVYEKNCLNSENPESYCSYMGELTRRLCRGVKLN